jgi:ABC-type transport system substrate-binding protein
MRLRPHRLILSLFAAIALPLASAQVLIVAQGTDAVTLDPHAATDSPSATVTSHIFETLFELTPEGEVVPGLAESYELSDDGLTLTLKVREGVTFHDGTPLTAHEVKASLDRFLDPENAFTFLFLLEPIQEVVVVDDMTVELRLDAPFAPLIGHLTHSSTAIVHAGVAAELGDGFARNPVGTGPFRFVSWEPNQAIELARYDGYWGEKPGVEGVRFLAVPENTTRMAMVESGAAHVAVRVPPQDIARLDSLSFIDVHNVSSVRTIYIYFNHNIEPFTDARVRQAVNYAVNNQDIADFVTGGAVRPSDAAIAPGIFGYTPVGSYDYDPERARELLAEAGYPDGFSTTLYSPSGRYLQDIQIAEAIQSMLAEVGIQAEIETLEWSAYLSATNQPAESNVVPMALLGWGTVTGDADYGLFPLFHTSEHVPAGSNRAFYSNPEVDALLDEARTTTDGAAREGLYRQALQIIREDAPWLFLHSETQLVAVNTAVEGLVIHPTERVLAHNASIR